MKIAYIHDWLVFFGGAEQVFFDIVQGKMPQVWNRKDLGGKIEEKIFTSFYNPSFNNPTNIKIESAMEFENIGKYYRNFMPIFPFFMKKLSKKIKKYNPDIVIISSFAIAKNIDIDTKKILYLHSPMQYIWSHYDEYVEKFSGPKKLIYKTSSKLLRKWDKKYKKFDKIYFNSNYTKQLFEEIYNRKGDKVIHPIIKKPGFEEINISKKFNIEGEYFIYIGRLVKLVKHLDKIIDIFNKSSKKLVVVGDGPDKDFLQKIAKNNIIFLGYLNSNSNEYRSLLKNAKSLVNITKESFGIVNYQASLVGTPIISINHGAINDIPGKKILIKNVEELKKEIEKI